MSRTILVGSGPEIQRVPDDAFVQGIKGLPSRMEARLAFMTRHHHMVRDFLIREMPRQPSPISPQQISLVTGLDFTEGICDPFGFGGAFVLSCARFRRACELGFPGDDFRHPA